VSGVVPDTLFVYPFGVGVVMSLFVLTKLFASLVTGMLGIPIGILPSVFLFRDLSNGLDDAERTKTLHALTLWGGMLIGWLAVSVVSWIILTKLFG